MAKSVLILNGPNLNLLGTREPDTYGSQTLDDVCEMCVRHGQALGLEVECRQSNHEGQLLDWIHGAQSDTDLIILNAGALTHTSIALGDAVRGTGVPVIELHISNVHGRETFRHHSYISQPAAGIIVGFGTMGYQLALDAAARMTA
jgi:3-dehydroquinate dehydratase-2